MEKKKFYYTQILVTGYYFFRSAPLILSENLWYDDAYELIIKFVPYLDIETLRIYGDHHLGFSLFIKNVATIIPANFIYHSLSILFIILFIFTFFNLYKMKFNLLALFTTQLLVLSSETVIEYSFRPKSYIYDFLLAILVITYFYKKNIKYSHFLGLSSLLVFYSNIMLIYLIYPLYLHVKKGFKLKYFIYSLLPIALFTTFVFNKGINKLLNDNAREYWSDFFIQGSTSFIQPFYNFLMYIRNFNDFGILPIILILLASGYYITYQRNTYIFISCTLPFLIIFIANLFSLYPLGAGRTDLVIFPIIAFSIYFFFEKVLEKVEVKNVYYLVFILLISLVRIDFYQQRDATKDILANFDINSFDKVYVGYYSVPQFMAYSDSNLFKIESRPDFCKHRSLSDKVVFLNRTKEDIGCRMIPITDEVIEELNISSHKKVLIFGFSTDKQNLRYFSEYLNNKKINYNLIEYPANQIVIYTDNN